MTSFLLPLSLAVIGALWAFWPAGGRRRTRRHRALQRRYLSLLHQPRHIGEATLRRSLDEMRRSHPDRSTAWQLRKLIADLERDRR